MIRGLRKNPLAILWFVASGGWMYGLIRLMGKVFDLFIVDGLSLLGSFFAALGLVAVIIAVVAVYGFGTFFIQTGLRRSLGIDDETQSDERRPDQAG